MSKALARCGLLLLLVLTAGEAAAFEPIGEIEHVRDDAYGTPPAQQRRVLGLAEGVLVDELVETLDSGELSIRFADGTRLALGAKSAVVLDEMVYAGGADDDFRIDLGVGLFHLVSGDIDATRVTIATPVSTIGNRGTDIAIQVLADDTTSLAVIEGLAVMTPAAGGLPVEIAAGRTGTVAAGSPGVQVADGLAGFAGQGLPAVGGAPAPDGDAGPGDNAGVERQTAVAAAVAAPAPAPAGGDDGDGDDGGEDGGGSGGDGCER